MNFDAIYTAALIVLGVVSAATVVWATHKGKLIDLLTRERDAWKNSTDRHESERKESDTRHEEVIKGYRERNETLRTELLKCTLSLGECRVSVADLTARTDFKPVWDFQQAWHAETKTMHEQIIATIKQSNETSTLLAPVLQEVSRVLREFGAKTQSVSVDNPTSNPVNVSAT